MIYSNYLSTEAYQKKLEAISNDKHSPDIALIKSQNIIDKMKNACLFRISEENSNFYEEIQEAVRTISRLRPGRKLLKKFLSQNIPIKVSEAALGRFDIIDKCLFISPKTHSYYVAGVDKHLRKHEFSLVFAHELIHTVHFLENSQETIKRNRLDTELIDPEFHCQEEQLTISGLLKPSDTISLCENAFLKARGWELRLDHNGLEIHSSVSPFLSIDHYIISRAHGTLEQHCKEHPESIHQSYKLDWLAKEKEKKLSCKNLYPLSIASFKGDRKSIDLLTVYGANIDVNDELGGPIGAACSN